MFGPEWFNDAWKIYARYMQRPRVYPGQLKAKVLLWPGNGFDGFALRHGTHHPTSPCQELAMQPHVGLFKKGNTWNPAKLGQQWRLVYQELQDVVQNFPSQTNSMMSGTTTDGATCNKMENLVRIWYIRATGTNLVLSKHASHWHRIEMIFNNKSSWLIDSHVEILSCRNKINVPIRNCSRFVKIPEHSNAMKGDKMDSGSCSDNWGTCIVLGSPFWRCFVGVQLPVVWTRSLRKNSA